MYPVCVSTASAGMCSRESRTFQHEPAVTELNRPLELRTEKLKNPHPSGGLGWFSWIVAGYSSRGYKLLVASRTWMASSEAGHFVPQIRTPAACGKGCSFDPSPHRLDKANCTRACW